jgi:hypothetical protein
MKPGYYWAIVFGDEMIVQVIDAFDGFHEVKTFMYG